VALSAILLGTTVGSRLSMRKIFEVLRLSVADGRSHREIARNHRLADDGREILRRAKLAGLTYPLPAGMSEAAVEGCFTRRRRPRRRSDLNLTGPACIGNCAGKA
jgi:hypothetical protein